MSEMMKIKIPVYLKVAVLLSGYTVLSWVVLGFGAAANNLILAFGAPIIFGAAIGTGFLYIFSHDKSFRLARIIEEKEKKSEKKWLNIFSHFGKNLASVLVGFFGGPLLAALTIAILLPRAKYKYFLVALINIPSSIFYIGLAKGTFLYFFG